MRFYIYSTCHSDYIPYFALVGAPQRAPQGYQRRYIGHDGPDPDPVRQRLGDTSGGGRDHVSGHYLRRRCVSVLYCDGKVWCCGLVKTQPLRQALHGSILMAVLATRYTLRHPENGRSHYFFTENDMQAPLRSRWAHKPRRLAYPSSCMSSTTTSTAWNAANNPPY